MQPQSPPQPPFSSLPTPQLGPPEPPVEPGGPITPQVIQPTQPPAQSFPAYNQPQPTAPVSPHGNYDFIMNAPHQAKPSLAAALPGGGQSKLMRGLLVLAGLMLLIIVFSVVKGIFTGDSNKPLLISVAQHQQQLVHLATNAVAEPSLSTNNKNFAATAQLSLASSQTDLVTYLGTIGTKKVSTKLLEQTTSAKTDADLTAAVAADTYNPTFHDVMKTGLGQYQLALQQALAKTPGQNGQKLLTDQYNQAKLLLEQLDTTSQ